jgi:hypothetical protein
MHDAMRAIASNISATVVFIAQADHALHVAANSLAARRHMAPLSLLKRLSGSSVLS